VVAAAGRHGIGCLASDAKEVAMGLRTLVVDDEPMARERIVGMLAQEPDVEVVGECADGAQAAAAIKSLSPDLVFLDIQMPVTDGFGALRRIEPELMPMIVFVTAYSEYALQAFNVRALDYLLKPFSRDRLQQTLSHAREQSERQRTGKLGKGLLALVENMTPRKYEERIVVKSGGRVFFVRTDDIEWIEAAGNYVRLHLANQTHVFRETMNDMEARLDPERFVRIHRSRIVNADRIRALEPWTSGEYLLVLQNGAHLRLSRNYREQLHKRLLRKR
jgi:two-component system LytT family response regulator